MNLNSLKPNAHYDMVHGCPVALEKDNDGSCLYRLNIVTEYGVKEGETEETQIGWMCYEVRTFEQPTKANLKKVVIRSIYDETAEFALVNAYNKHVLGIREDEAAVAEYKDFLQFTYDLDAQIVKDLSNL